MKVYVPRRGSVYHVTESCGQLRRARYRATDLIHAQLRGKPPCTTCGGQS